MNGRAESLYKSELLGGIYEERVKEILNSKYEEIPLAYLHSFGCQQNVADGEKLRGLIYDMGYGFTDKIEEANLVLYNTCAVRENAHNRVFGNVGAVKNIKQIRKDMLVVLCGCMTQQEDVAEKIRNSYPYVDIVFGTNAMHLFPKMVYDRLSTQKRIFINQGEPLIVEEMPIKREVSYKANVPIMQGCNNFCSYCIVPYVRGREISRTADSIIAEVKNAVLEGCKEITLLGQNVNSYGKDIGTDFSSLLRELDKIEGDFWIKFVTSHPKDCTKELIDTIADSSHICHHLHLPVQSGSDRILTLMNRGYTIKDYLSMIEYARERISDVTFSSDIIVGFPGESYEEFRETVNLIKKIEYSMLYTFIYSKRTGTVAAKFENPISEKEKGNWMNELLAAQQEILLKNNNKMIGSTQRVLVDSIGKYADGYLSGRNMTGTVVEFEGNHSLLGHFVDVDIDKAMRWAITGRIKN